MAAREAAIYSRLSKDRPEQTSTARQEADCAEAIAREGLRLVGTFRDILSGFQDVRRPEFEAAVRWLKAAPGRTLFVWKLDRLSRRGMGQVGTLLDDLEASGGRVVFLRDGLDSSVPGHRMVIAILSEQARQESVNTSVRAAAGLATRRKAGKWIGGRPPFGWQVVAHALPPDVKPEHYRLDPKREPGKLVLHPEHSRIVRSMVDDALAGKSLRAIARRLSDQGAPTGRGGRWTAATVSGILRSPVLCGWLPARNRAVEPARDAEGRPVEVGEPLITPGERRRLLAALEARTMADFKTGKRRSAGRTPGALLTGVLRCAECGGAMHAAGDKNYGCGRAAAGGPCPGNSVSRPHVERLVADRLLSRLAASEPGDPVLEEVAAVLLAAPADATAEAERDALLAEVADLEARLADLEDARYLRGEFSGEGGDARYERLHTALSGALEAKRGALKALPPPRADLGALLDPVEVREQWDRLDLDARRSALRAGIRRVEVRRATKRGGVFDPGRLRIVFAGDGE